MRAVIQRVRRARVIVDGETVGEIGKGILTLLGVRNGDTEKDVDWIIKKIGALRIFEDDQGKMNLSMIDLKLEHLIVSQFTLWGDASKGNRPSFIEAARPEIAKTLYERAIEQSRVLGVKTETGRFQAHMLVEIENDGPVTMMIDSSRG